MHNLKIEANREVVKALMERLTETFEKFADEMAQKDERGLGYVDAVMGCHNFYKRIILDLESRTGNTGQIIATAIGTLREAFKQ